MMRSLILLISTAWFMSGAALAHKGSDAYLDVQQLTSSSAPEASTNPLTTKYGFTLAVAVKDLDQILPLDADANGRVTWGEVRAVMPQVLSLVNQSVQTSVPEGLNLGTQPAGASCQLDWTFSGAEQRGDGAYLRVVAQTRCASTNPLAMRYTLFKTQDATHRLLVSGRVDGRDLLTTARPQDAGPLVLTLGRSGLDGAKARASGQPNSNRWTALRDYAAAGMHHLLEGYDHLAFLLALVLPLKLRLGQKGSRGVWVTLLRTVTAFTIGHSITLILATLGWTQASPTWVEPVIALSIAVTALLNLRPQPWLRTDVLALVFGLVHGFGFAGLLLEAAAPDGLLPWALAGFNLGIEAGQLLAVGMWVLASQALLGRAWYARVVVRGGSVLLTVLAAWWFWQRVS